MGQCLVVLARDLGAQVVDKMQGHHHWSTSKALLMMGLDLGLRFADGLGGLRFADGLGLDQGC